MTLYLDTSVLVTALTSELQTPYVQDWMKTHEAEHFVISEWVTTEFSAALSVKLRSDKITSDERSIALTRFSHLAERAFHILNVGSLDFASAARLADQSGLGLRAGDALHLAVARRGFATVCTRDKKLADACTVLGVKTVFL